MYLHKSLKRRNLLQNCFEKGRFSNTIFADNAYAITTMEACIANEKKWLASPNERIFNFDRGFWSVFIIWKRKFDFMTSFWFFNKFYFFECAFSRFGKTRSGSGSESVDQFFFTLQKCLLLIIFFFFDGAILGFFCNAK